MKALRLLLLGAVALAAALSGGILRRRRAYLRFLSALLTIGGALFLPAHLAPVVTSLTGVATCDSQELASLEAGFQNASRTAGSDASASHRNLARSWAQSYVAYAESCYQQLASAEEPPRFDDGGVWAGGPPSPTSGAPAFNTRLLATKWGENSPFAGGQDVPGPGTPGGNVYYSFMANGVAGPGLDVGENNYIPYNITAVDGMGGFLPCFLDEIRGAFSAWSAIADIQFTEVPDNGAGVDGAGAAGDIRIGAHSFDGPSNVLAHGFFPPPNGTTIAGDLHFDTSENWTCDTTGIDIGIVALHEIGHNIGLSHENPPPTAVMNPAYNSALNTLRADDITGAQSIYGPKITGSGTYNASTTVALSTLNAEARANTTLTLDIPFNDYNFSAVINGTPSAAFIAPGPGNPEYIAGTHPALGDVMGTVASASTLGLTGNVCNSAATPNFTFLNATVDITDTIDAVPQASTNPGSGGTLDNMWSDNGSSTTGPDATAPWNAAWPGMDAGEGANRLPAQVDEYPSYLNILFDPDFPATPGTNAVQPLARYAGAVNVVDTTVVLDLVIFAQGALSSAFAAPHPFNATAALGYTAITVLNDTTTAAAKSDMTDFCSPVNTITTLFGLSRANTCNPLTVPAANCDTPGEISSPVAGANKHARYANPTPAGPYSWLSQHQSLRDADDDGTENSLDACPVDADAYNPRTGLPAAEDPDSDGIPGRDDPATVGEQLLAGTGCDPTPLTNTGAKDHDNDGWLNTGDNCPLVANPTQLDSELNVAYAITAPGGGPRGDGIGDPCDADDAVSDGAFLTSASTNPFTIVNNDVDPGTGDGYSASAESGTPLCGNAKNDDDRVNNPGNPFPAALAPDDAVIDDGCPGGPPMAGTYSEAWFYIGTSATGRCGMGIEAGPSAQWPSDFVSGGVPNSTDRINVTDLTSFIAPVMTKRLNTSPGTPTFDKRWDLSPGRGVFTLMINVTDLTALIAASSGFPPMLGGARAFGGPVCPGD